MTSWSLRVAALAFVVFIPLSTKAATTDFRVFLDVDDDGATGCTIAGMAGIDQLLVTRVTVGESSADVSRVYRQTCSSATGLGAEIEIDGAGWPVGFQPASGNVLVETRIPTSAFGTLLPQRIHLGVQATSDAATHTAIAGAGGAPLYFPASTQRRRSVTSPGSDRVIVLDGAGDDWFGLSPLVDGIASSGAPSLRMVRVYAHAGHANDEFLYFRFDANLSNDAPFANDDSYTRQYGEALNVSAPGVLANDGDPNGLPLTALPLSAPSNGTVTLNPDGSFTYTPADATSTASDSFEYRASNGTKDSSPAQVHIEVSSAVNVAPDGVDDSYAGTEDTALEVTAPGVLANDTDANGDPLTAALLAAPTHGAVVLNANGGFTYTPAAGYFGSDTFTYTVSDGALSDTATVTITLASVNDAPHVRTATFAIDENSANGTAVGTVTVADPDLTDSHSFSITAGNSGGAFAINAASGAITVANTLAVDFELTPQFLLTVRAVDNGSPAMSDTATVTININDLNEAPAASDQTVTTDEDTAALITLVTSDQDGDALTYTIVTAPAHGTLTGTAPDLTYTPAADYNGPDTFTFRANDGALDSNVATVTISVTAVNDAPVATGDAHATDEDTPLNVAAAGVLANDTDIDGDALSAVVVSGTTNGVLTLNADGSFGYTPNANFNGTDSFTYKANDGALDSNVVTVTITVNAVNDAPTVAADAFLTNEDTPLSVPAAGVLANDTDVEGDALVAILVSGPSSASAFTLNADGSFSYAPNANFNGSDSFTYKANDGAVDSTSVTVVITVNPVNDVPVATGESYVTNEDTALNVPASGVLGNDSDVDGDVLNAVLVTGPANAATFLLNGDGSFSYTPDAEFNGSDSFTYKANDGSADSNIVTVNVTVNAVNDLPVATGDAYGTGEDTPLNVAATGVLGNDSDTETDPLTAVLVSDVANGTLTLNGDGSFLYAPNVDFNGSDSFTYKANDGSGDSNTVTVILTVNAVNDGPVITSPATAMTGEGTPFTFNGADVISIADVDAATGNLALALSVSNGTLALSGTTGLTVSGDGTSSVTASGTLSDLNAALDGLVYTADAEFNGADTLNVNVDDNGNSGAGGALNDSSSVAITINSVNDEPSFTSGGNVSVVEDSGAYSAAWASAISSGPANESAQVLTFNITGNTTPSLFAVAPAISAAGVLTFTPAANAFGTSTITVELRDDGGTANGGDDTFGPVTFDIELRAQNDEPTFAGSGDVTVNEDSGAYSAAWATAIDPGTNEGAQTLTFVVTGNTNLPLFASAPAVSSTGLLTFTPTADANGSADITLHLSDDGGTADGGDDTSGDVTFTINVTAVNDEPSFTSGGNISVVEDSGAYSAAWASAISQGPADESGQTLTFNVTGNDNPSLFAVAPSISAAGVLTFTPAADAFGTSTITIALQDDGGTANGGDDTFGPVTFDIELRAQNDEPVFTGGGNVTVNEDSGAYSAAWATAIDPGANEAAQTLTFVITANTDTSLFATPPAVSSTGVLTFTPAANANGSTDITLHLSDDGGTADGGDDTSGDVTFTINVTAVNDEPSFTGGGDVSVVEDSGAYSAAWASAISEGPADESGQTLTFSVTDNDNASLFSVAPSISTAGVLSFTVAADAFGTATLTVELKDDGGTANGGDDTFGPMTFAIEVRGQNDEPSFNGGGDVTVDEDSGAYSTAWATAINPGTNEASQTLTFVVTNNTNSSLFASAPAVSSTGVLTFTPTADANGSADITLHLSDDGGTADGGDDTSGDVTFKINVTAVNDEPTFSAPASTSAEEDGGSQTAAGFATSISAGPADESGQTLTFNLSQTAIDPTLSFTTPPAIDPTTGSLTYEAAANAYGSATYDVTLSDDGGGVSPDDDTSATHSLTITVNPINDAPSFSIAGDVQLDEDGGAIAIPYATSISQGDGDTGQTLTFNLSQTGSTGALTFDASPTIDAGTGVLSFTTTADTNGTATFSVTLSDDGSSVPPNSNTSAPQVFTITVNAVNDPPEFTIASDPPFVAEGAGAQTVNNFATAIDEGGAADEDSQTVSFSLSATGTSGSLAFDVAPAIDVTGNLTYTPTAGTNGTATFDITLTDDGSNVAPNVNTSAAQSFTIAVERGPSVTSSTPADGASVPRNQDLSFDFDESVSVEADAFSITCNADPTLLAYTITTDTGTTIVVNPDSDLPAGSCTVTLDKDKVHDVDPYDPPDGLAGNYVVNFTTNSPPVADDDADFARGNVTLIATDGEGVLVGDTDADLQTLSVVGAGSPVATAQGGTITFTSGGGYTYLPQAGDQNLTDTVDYTVSDGFGGTDVGTLSITVGPRYVFVDDDNGTAGTGTQADPYKTLANLDASPYLAANDVVIIRSGSYTDGSTLEAGQQYIGQGVSADVTATQGTRTFTILPAGVAPVINRTGGDALTVATNNTLRGLSINTTTSGRGVVGNAFGTLTINDSTIATNGGAALDLTNGAGAIALTSTSSTGSPTQGVNLNTVTGTVALGSGAITSPTGVGFNVSGGTAAITYGGNVTGSGTTAVAIATHTTNNVTLSGTITGSANGGIAVSGKTSGTVSFSGAQNLSTGASTGVSLSGNTGGTVAFSGTGLAITTTTGAAFSATGGGTVSVTGTTNSINVTGAGSGLTLNGVTVASGNNVTFNTMNAAGTSATGLALTSLGGSGSVVVNGGTISSITGLSMTTMGTVGTSLSSVTLNGTTAISGSAFGTLTVSGVTINAANQALNLTTGTVNGTFASVGSGGNGNVTPVFLSGVAGNFTVSAGSVVDAGTANTVFQVAGGSATINWAGSLTQAQNAALINVTTANTGTINWSGSLSATSGTGILFNDADGSYSFSGSTTLNGGSAGIAISNGSAGAFAFGATTNVTGTATVIPFSVASSTAGVTYSGNLTQNNNLALLSVTTHSGGTLTFQTGTLSAGNGPGLQFSNADGTYNFNGTTTLNGGDAGIDVLAGTDATNGSQGTFSFGAGAAITNPTGSVIDIRSSKPAFTYSGSFSKTTTGVGFNAQNNQGGSITIDGSSATETKSLSTSTSAAVFLDNNDNCTITFSGNGLALTTTTGAAFTATNGGTVNVTGTANTITTSSGAAVNVTGTTIGGSGITFQSVNHNGNNTAITLNNTGSGPFTVTGVGTTAGTGGTIQNIVGADAVVLNTTGGLVTLRNMNIQDITAGSDGTATTDIHSNVDAIHGLDVNGGLTLNKVTIQRISDNGINGSVDAPAPTATVWNGLTLTNCTITNTNRFNTSYADANYEGAVFIKGIQGTVSVTGNSISNAGNGLTLHPTAGTLDATIQSNTFATLYKEIGTLSVGNFGIDIVQEGSASSTIRIGDPAEVNSGLGNTFTNAGDRASIRVVANTGSTGTMKSSISRNTLTVTDHSSPGVPAGTTTYNFPMGGVLLRALGTGNYESIFASNVLTQLMHADGGLGMLTILAEKGDSEFIVRNNTFDKPWDAPLEVRADGQAGGQTSAKILFTGNTYIDGIVGDATTDLGGQSPYDGFYVQVRNGGKMDFTMQNEATPLGLTDTSSAHGGVSFYAQTTSAGDIFNLFLQNIQAPRGFRLLQPFGTYNLFRNGSASGTEQGVLQDNGNRGGGGVDTTNPPTVTVSGTINLTAIAPQLPSISQP